MAVMEQARADGLVADAVIPQSDTELRALWEIRENFTALYRRQPIFLYDVSLPIRDMPAYVTEVQARLKRRWPASRCDVLGPIGDGKYRKGSGEGKGLSVRLALGGRRSLKK